MAGSTYQETQIFSIYQIYERENKFGKGYSPGSVLMTGTNVYALPKLKIDLSYHNFVKDNAFESKVKFPPRGTPISMVVHYCENHSMSYVYQSTKDSPCNRALTARNITNVWILSILKNSTEIQQVMEAISNQHITVRYNRIHDITARREKYFIKIFKKNYPY